MARSVTGLDRARAAIGRKAWPEAYEILRSLDASQLGPEGLEALADCAWWLSLTDESTQARQKAYAAFAAIGDDRRAGFQAIALFHDHSWREPEMATGWLKRAQRHLASGPESVERGLLEVTQAEVVLWQGQADEAARLAGAAIELGRRLNSADVLALGIETLGRALIVQGRRAEGLALLDEAMTSVVAGQLTPFFTGTVYCTVLFACLQIADLHRAGVWTDAAAMWCETLPAGTPFHGMCRLNRVEVVSLRGEWDEADADARRASEELMRFQPSLAAKALYWHGEIRRRMGDLASAEAAFVRAHGLGLDPQPGLALVRLAQGKVDAAAAALRGSLEDGRPSPMERVRLLAATVDVELVRGDHARARAAADELGTLAAETDFAAIAAAAAAARGAVRLAEGDGASALHDLRRACALFHDLQMPYEEARTRMAIGIACLAAGDEEGGRLELAAARSAFQRLGAGTDARTAGELLEGRAAPAGLSAREVEVLRLVAAGKSNRDIAADLFISDRTVARHLSNIFRKLDVGSRTAATVFAFEHELV